MNAYLAELIAAERAETWRREARSRFGPRWTGRTNRRCSPTATQRPARATRASAISGSKTPFADR